MADEVTLEGLPALRALADPFRLKLLELLVDAPCSVRELSAALGVPRNRLHYHVNVLERHGIIRVAATRDARGGAERLYERTTRTFAFPNQPVPPSVASSITQALATAAREIDQRLVAGDADMAMVGRSRLRLTEAQHLELIAKMRALAEEYEAAADPHGDRLTFVFALYAGET